MKKFIRISGKTILSYKICKIETFLPKTIFEKKSEIPL